MTRNAVETQNQSKILPLINTDDTDLQRKPKNLTADERG